MKLDQLLADGIAALGLGEQIDAVATGKLLAYVTLLERSGTVRTTSRRYANPSA